MTANVNASPVVATVADNIRALGAAALATAQKAEGMKRNSRARFTYVLTQCATVELHLLRKDAKGAALLNEYAYIGDLLDPEIFGEAAGEKNKHATFIIDEIIRVTTGLEKPTSAQRDCVKAAMPVAFNLLRKVDPAQVEITKSGALKVPYVAVHNEPAQDAKESIKEEYEARKGGTYTIDGSDESHSFNYLARAVTPPKPRQQQESKVDDSTLLGVLRVMAKGNAERIELATWFASLSTEEIFQIIRTGAAMSGDRADN